MNERTDSQDWLLTELETGLQKLLCLNLDRQPASEVLLGTADAWFEAITFGRAWDQSQDSPRIRQAFVILAGTREAWPAPKHLLDAMPVLGAAMLRYEVKPASKAAVQAAAVEVATMLRTTGKMAAAEQGHGPD